MTVIKTSASASNFRLSLPVSLCIEAGRVAIIQKLISEHAMKNFLTDMDFEGLRKALAENPSLANEGLPYDGDNSALAHPLHRICDGVCEKRYTEDEAIRIATLFLEYGANINGFPIKEKQDTPLIAAASLRADKLALFYIDKGADTHPSGCHGGTALHWAAWCGRDIIVERLINEKAEINKLCIDFKSTPLLWAMHGLRFGGPDNLHHQAACVRLLLDAGADKSIPTFEGYLPKDFVMEEETELLILLA